MGRPAVKWGAVERYFLNRGYIIESRGGEKIIKLPIGAKSRGIRSHVVIGHHCCNSAGAELLDCYVQGIRRAFGVSWQDILNDK